MSLLVGAFGILPAAAATVSVADNTAEWTNQDGEAVTHVKPVVGPELAIQLFIPNNLYKAKRFYKIDNSMSIF